MGHPFHLQTFYTLRVACIRLSKNCRLILSASSDVYMLPQTRLCALGKLIIFRLIMLPCNLFDRKQVSLDGNEKKSEIVLDKTYCTGTVPFFMKKKKKVLPALV